MNQSKVAVRRFANRSGVASWRVEGRIDGVRFRRNFKTREEAAAEKASLEIKAAQMASGLSAVVTHLTRDQVREAEAGFHRLHGHSHSLTFYLDYALANYREPSSPEPLGDAISAYVAVKARENERGMISISQLRHIRTNLAVLQRHSPGKTIAELSIPHITLFLEHGGVSLKTYNNRRGIVSTFLKFALRKEWINANPVEKIPYHRIAHRRGSAKKLSAAQAQELIAYVEGYEGGRLGGSQVRNSLFHGYLLEELLEG